MTDVGEDALTAYRRKRDFGKTPEPAGGRPRDAGETIFVVQKHAASRLHYDFRLEVDGVLKSWAVPKGPSTDPRAKRLAMRVEDHPLEYADFEGVIPQGEYGGGTVLVWDIGRYQNITQQTDEITPAAEAIERGHLRVRLAGTKLKGAYALTRVAKDARGRERWILVKMRDSEAEEGREVARDRPESALTGRSIEEVAREEGL
jgi:DNA ligase D-like protein (predicted 3'-phosphoesterase)